MIATALLVSNLDEVNRSKMKVEKLGMDEKDIVQPILIEVEFFCPLNSILFAFKNLEGNIKTIIGGTEIIFKWDESLYDKIKAHFTNN